MKMYRPMLTVTEAAEQLGVSRSYLYDRVKDGEISTVHLGNGRNPQTRILQEDLEDFIATRRVAAR